MYIIYALEEICYEAALVKRLRRYQEVEVGTDYALSKPF